MKRKSIAIALGGMLALPLWVSSAAALEIYGKASGSVDFSSNDEETANREDSTLAFSSNASRLGFKGDEQLNDSLTLTYQAEMEFGLDTGGWKSTTTGRNTYLGLKGGFGEFRLGRHDTPYKLATSDQFSDLRGDYNAIVGSINGSILFDQRNSNTVLYMSPAMEGFQVLAAYILDTASDDFPQSEEPKNIGTSLAATYSKGSLSLSAAMETYDTSTATLDKAKATKLSGGWDFGQGTKVNLILEDAESSTPDSKRSAFYLSGSHTMGNTVLRAAYGKADDMDSTDSSGADHFVLGVSQKMSKETELYALYANTSNDDNGAYGLVGVGNPTLPAAGFDVSSISFGIIKNFSGKFM